MSTDELSARSKALIARAQRAIETCQLAIEQAQAEMLDLSARIDALRAEPRETRHDSDDWQMVAEALERRLTEHSRGMFEGYADYLDKHGELTWKQRAVVKRELAKKGNRL